MSLRFLPTIDRIIDEAGVELALPDLQVFQSLDSNGVEVFPLECLSELAQQLPEAVKDSALAKHLTKSQSNILKGWKRKLGIEQSDVLHLKDALVTVGDKQYATAEVLLTLWGLELQSLKRDWLADSGRQNPKEEEVWSHIEANEVVLLIDCTDGKVRPFITQEDGIRMYLSSANTGEDNTSVNQR